MCWLTFESLFIVKRSAIHTWETDFTVWLASAISTAHGSLSVFRCESRFLDSNQHWQFHLGLIGIDSVLFPVFPIKR
jgi:hypothetical protein